MDLPEIGAHCSLDSCHELDLLPIRCSCGRIFCRHHISPDAHACSSALTSTSRKEPSSSHKIERCAFEGCNKPSLEAFIADSTDRTGRLPAICSRCHQSFCVSHRYPESHSCLVEEALPEPKNEAAHALLQKHFPSRASHPNPKQPSSTLSKAPVDPKKLAQLQRIQLMKMRHRAVPGDPKDKSASVAIDERVHLQVSLEGGSEEGKTYWFRKSVGAGKALDCLANHLCQSSADRPHLRLYKHSLSDTESEGPIMLRTDQDLTTQVQDGCKIVLIRSDSPSVSKSSGIQQ